MISSEVFWRNSGQSRLLERHILPHSLDSWHASSIFGRWRYVLGTKNPGYPDVEVVQVVEVAGVFLGAGQPGALVMMEGQPDWAPVMFERRSRIAPIAQVAEMTIK